MRLTRGGMSRSQEALEEIAPSRPDQIESFPSQAMFSLVARRLHAEINPLYRIREEIHNLGHPVIDLVSGNVNELGIVFPQDILEAALTRAARQSVIYRPDSFGREAAREAISAYYESQGIMLPARSILLTPGTSIAYWYCFRLLADEGDEVLCPQPSYPLFDYISSLSGIRLIPYRLLESDRWRIDLNQMEETISTRTKALVLISPHNPTGNVARPDELQALSEIAARHDLAIISDEVFSEFLLDNSRLPRLQGYPAPLVLTLNGLSKMYALPGMKLGWLAVSGDEGRVREALRALELISDTFLPVNEIVQAAVPEIFSHGTEFLAQYREQIRLRWDIASGLLAQSKAVSFVPPAGGFYLSLRLTDRDEETTAESILRTRHMLLHPGHYYDMAPHHLVLSFVHQPSLLESSFPRLLEMLEAPSEDK